MLTNAATATKKGIRKSRSSSFPAKWGEPPIIEESSAATKSVAVSPMVRPEVGALLFRKLDTTLPPIPSSPTASATPSMPATPSDQQGALDDFCHEVRVVNTSIIGKLSDLATTIQLFGETLEVNSNRISPDLKEVLLAFTNSQKSSVQEIDICVRHLGGVINNKLDLSKLDSGKLELNLSPADPQAVIKEARSILKNDAIKKKLKVYIKASCEESKLNVDSDRLRQIFMNLLSNAIKFSKEGGEITIGMEEPEVGETNTTVKFFVKDHGEGMTAEGSQKIFGRFSQANSTIAAQHGGSGLGLNICKGLVELMGGKIDFTTVKGQGTQFNFTIKCPNVLSAANQREVSPLLTSNKIASPVLFSGPKLTRLAKIAPQGKGKRILIVDDNKVNREMVQRLLEKLGYETDLAQNGAEAVEMFKSMKVYYDAIVMDKQMPVMDGYEAARRIRQYEKESLPGALPVPIIVLTGSDMKKELEAEALEAGMNAYLTKPVSAESMKDVLNKLFKSQALRMG